MASFELREPKKKPRYYKLIANVLVNGKIERRYGRFDFDPTELKNARARNAAAKAAAAEFVAILGQDTVLNSTGKGRQGSQQCRKDLCSSGAGVHSFKPFSYGTFSSSEGRL